MKKVIKILSKLILVIAFLNIFAYLVMYVTIGGTQLGAFTQPLIVFSEFPQLIKEVLRESSSSKKLNNINPAFHANDLKYDVFAMNANYDSSEWTVSLSNLRNDSIIHRWYLNEKDYFRNTDRIFSHARLFGPILLKDRSIIFQNHPTANLYKLDRQSKIIWHNTDHIFHHSISLDGDGNVWACTVNSTKSSDKKKGKYEGDYITKIDAENGNTLYDKSIREILIENDLTYLVYGIVNGELNGGKDFDPLHLNDIESVLNDGPYWKTGDLFLSVRNISSILLYRPSTNKVLRVIAGPFLSQHDVDIQSDSIISIFNNNVSHLPAKFAAKLNSELHQSVNPLFNKISNVVKYNFVDSTFTPVYQEKFIENNILTKSEGLHHIFSNGDMFVESTNEGKVYIFNEKELLLKKYLNPIIDNQVEYPNWTRVYENINF